MEKNMYIYCGTASSVIIFKNKVDIYLRRADYTYIIHAGVLDNLPSWPLPWMAILLNLLVKHMLKRACFDHVFLMPQCKGGYSCFSF